MRREAHFLKMGIHLHRRAADVRGAGLTLFVMIQFPLTIVPIAIEDKSLNHYIVWFFKNLMYLVADKRCSRKVFNVTKREIP
jgi:hypothetical protein